MLKKNFSMRKTFTYRFISHFFPESSADLISISYKINLLQT